MANGLRKAGEFCWTNMLTPRPAEAREFFGRILGWTYFEMPGIGHGVRVGGRNDSRHVLRIDRSEAIAARALLVAGDIGHEHGITRLGVERARAHQMIATQAAADVAAPVDVQHTVTARHQHDAADRIGRLVDQDAQRRTGTRRQGQQGVGCPCRQRSCQQGDPPDEKGGTHGYFFLNCSGRRSSLPSAT
jgi:catechol 2,3-dioxygenase-like lactoylglutathione lyase family enzyme